MFYKEVSLCPHGWRIQGNPTMLHCVSLKPPLSYRTLPIFTESYPTPIRRAVLQNNPFWKAPSHLSDTIRRLFDAIIVGKRQPFCCSIVTLLLFLAICRDPPGLGGLNKSTAVASFQTMGLKYPSC